MKSVGVCDVLPFIFLGRDGVFDVAFVSEPLETDLVSKASLKRDRVKTE